MMQNGSHGCDYSSTDGRIFAPADAILQLAASLRNCDMAQLDPKDQLRKGLEDTGLSINELARRSGVHKATVFRILSGAKDHAPSTRTLARLNNALDDARRGMSGGSELDRPAAIKQQLERDLSYQQRSSPAQIVETLVKAVEVLLQLELSDHLKLITEDAEKIFAGLGNMTLKASLAVALKIMNDDQADTLRTLETLRAIAADRGDNFSFADPDFLRALRSIKEPRPPQKLTPKDEFLWQISHLMAGLLDKAPRMELTDGMGNGRK